MTKTHVPLVHFIFQSLNSQYKKLGTFVTKTKQRYNSLLYYAALTFDHMQVGSGIVQTKRHYIE